MEGSLEHSSEQHRQVAEQNIQYDSNLCVKTYVGGKFKKKKKGQVYKCVLR